LEPEVDRLALLLVTLEDGHLDPLELIAERVLRRSLAHVSVSGTYSVLFRPRTTPIVPTS